MTYKEKLFCTDLSVFRLPETVVKPVQLLVVKETLYWLDVHLLPDVINANNYCLTSSLHLLTSKSSSRPS